MQQQLLEPIVEMAVYNNVVKPSPLKWNICNNVAHTPCSHITLFRFTYSTHLLVQSDSRLDGVTACLPLWVFSLNKNYLIYYSSITSNS